MALFGSKKKTDEVKKTAKAAAPRAKAPKAEKVTKAVAVVSPAEAKSAATNENNRVILRPRITEKASLLAESGNVFTFEITSEATKLQVRKAVASIYGVIPVKVSIARNPSKNVFSRGKMGMVSGVKKAYVYLKKGDKIELV